mmetsp:Transcript_8174/g.18961  ORF Transcript_8174/g.18961 Transcript_8174/m.18961 type:complete len:199 (-) Transcript_8174:14-610(-)
MCGTVRYGRVSPYLSRFANLRFVLQPRHRTPHHVADWTTAMGRFFVGDKQPLTRPAAGQESKKKSKKESQEKKEGSKQGNIAPVGKNVVTLSVPCLPVTPAVLGHQKRKTTLNEWIDQVTTLKQNYLAIQKERKTKEQHVPPRCWWCDDTKRCLGSDQLFPPDGKFTKSPQILALLGIPVLVFVLRLWSWKAQNPNPI